MHKLLLSRILMVLTIMLLAAFEGYWLHKLYKDEYQNFKREVDVSFRESMNKLQLRRFENDTTLTTRINRKTPPLAGANKKKTQPKIEAGKSVIIFTNKTKGASSVNDINIDSISSVMVTRSGGFNFKGVPPPGLVEFLLKQKIAGAKDSIRINYRSDSSLKRTTLATSGIKIVLGSRDSLRTDVLVDTGLLMPAIRINDQKKTFHQTITDGNTVPDDVQQPSMITRFLSDNKTINDSIPVGMVDSAFKKELEKTNKKIPFTILFKTYTDSSLLRNNVGKDSSTEVLTSKVFVGFNTPYSYQAKFDNVVQFIINEMQLQIGGSVILLLLVIGSFVLMYRNLIAQQKLALIKNDFISNITHELKTPIATVNVAIEALRNFNAIQSPEKTKEYLDISAAELQRLSLLVDKVLKLSMFEKNAIELNKENFDLEILIAETLHIMKLQFEKQKAGVTFHADKGSFMMHADKLHITSVIFNLLDNALKYSEAPPVIDIHLSQTRADMIRLTVTDQGIGIASQHQSKIFDKFFRVPTGNKHNIKGYGLGLSYVNEVVKSHGGTIKVVSEVDKGSSFVIDIPKQVD